LSLVARRIVESVPELPTLPAVATLIMETALDEHACTADLARVLERDQAMTAKLLRLTNSALFAPRQPVTTVQRAASFLGTRCVRNLALGVYTYEALAGARRRRTATDTRLWLHALAVGLVASKLGRGRPPPEADHYFTSGLLHDVGKLVLELYDPAGRAQVAQVATREGRSISEEERQRWGTHHAAVGATLAQHWGLPAPIREVIAHHHDLLSAVTAERWLSRLTCCVAIADRVCWDLELSSEQGPAPELPEWVWDWADVEPGRARRLAEGARGEVAETAVAFGLDREDVERRLRALSQANQALTRLTSEVCVGVEAMLPTSGCDTEGSDLERAIARIRQENQLLNSLGTTDPLTGTCNAMYFNMALTAAIAHAGRTDSDLALLGVALQEDCVTTGLDAQDAHGLVFVALARLLTEEARAGDTVCRIGDRELAIILPNTERAAAASLVRAIEEAIRRPLAQVRGREMMAGAAVAVVSWEPGQDAEAFRARLDDALAEALRRSRAAPLTKSTSGGSARALKWPSCA